MEGAAESADDAAESVIDAAEFLIDAAESVDDAVESVDDAAESTVIDATESVGDAAESVDNADTVRWRSENATLGPSVLRPRSCRGRTYEFSNGSDRSSSPLNNRDMRNSLIANLNPMINRARCYKQIDIGPSVYNYRLR